MSSNSARPTRSSSLRPGATGVRAGAARRRGRKLNALDYNAIGRENDPMTDSSSVTLHSVDKFDAARRQIECAIRLVAAEEDELAIHTLVMAAFSILEDLSKGHRYYEEGINPHLTRIGLEALPRHSQFPKAR